MYVKIHFSALSFIIHISLAAAVEEEMVLPWETTSGEELRFPFPCVQMEVSSFNGEVMKSVLFCNDSIVVFDTA